MAQDPVVLENGALRVMIMPSVGARVASFSYHDDELLLQPVTTEAKTYAAAGADQRFEDGDPSGMDECLPTVTRTSALTPGGPAPDHGDFWAIAWNVIGSPSSTQVMLRADGFSRPLRFTKRLTLHDSFLQVEYNVQNLSREKGDYLYACHPLFAISAGDRILLPPDVDHARVEYSRSMRLGKKGDTVAWPITLLGTTATDLSRVEDPSDGTAEMLYAGPLSSGWCALYRAETRRGVLLRFDPKLLPCVGVWICCAGWPEQKTEGQRQMAVALEPTMLGRGSLEDAIREAVAPSLGPAEATSWQIDFHPIGGKAGMSYDEFFAAVLAFNQVSPGSH
jgi:hypothetical protein